MILWRASSRRKKGRISTYRSNEDCLGADFRSVAATAVDDTGRRGGEGVTYMNGDSLCRSAYSDRLCWCKGAGTLRILSVRSVDLRVRLEVAMKWKSLHGYACKNARNNGGLHDGLSDIGCRCEGSFFRNRFDGNDWACRELPLYILGRKVTLLNLFVWGKADGGSKYGDKHVRHQNPGWPCTHRHGYVACPIFSRNGSIATLFLKVFKLNWSFYCRYNFS